MDYMLRDNDERLVLFTLVQKARYVVLYLVTLFFAPYTFKHLHHRVGHHIAWPVQVDEQQRGAGQHIATSDQLLRVFAGEPNLLRDIMHIVTYRDALGRR